MGKENIATDGVLRIAERTALITGAGSGMGRSAAELFAAEGAHIVAVDRDAAAVDATVAAIRAAGGSAIGAVVDVTRSAEVEAAVQAAVRAFGALHVLYNNAGIWLPDDGPAPDLDEEVWDRIIAVNLKGAFLGCKFAIPHLVEAGGGSIINVSSVSALRAGKDSCGRLRGQQGWRHRPHPQRRQHLGAEAGARQRHLPRIDRHADDPRLLRGPGRGALLARAHRARPRGHGGRGGADRAVAGL